MDVEKKLEKTLKKIKSLEIQGAQEIAIESLKVLRELAEKKGFDSEFINAANKLIKARPTGVSVYNCLKIVKKEKTLESIDRILRYLEKAQEWLAYNGSKLIKNDMIIMTHCHSSSVLNIFRRAKEVEHKNFKVIVTETRPNLQGLKTARELVKMGIPIYYIVDSAGPFFMAAADMLLVGADAIRNEGILNKIGTYPLALAAREVGSPVYIAATKDKIDYDLVSKIEDRPDREIANPRELEKTGGEIENPAFDLTPWKLVTAVITESGILGRKEMDVLLEGKFEI
ncbi:MAG: translation initiation factor eIF-2B [Candidatus Aenigmarchaeota archaeon]|nr:translation initiation factor eIF-2B [Candidatus Aenigmarchaeota archaeon]